MLPFITVAGDVVKKAGTGLGPRQIHDYELLYFPDGGKSVYKVGDKAYTLDEPSFIVTRPGEHHVYEYDPLQPSRHLFIHFEYNPASRSDSPLRILEPGGPSVIPVKGELPVGMMKQILYVAYANSDRLQQRGSALLLALLEEIDGLCAGEPKNGQPDRMPPQIVKALDFIDKHLEQPITIDSIAQKVGWSHEHFSRSFVRYLGRTPREMVVQRRIERACQLLLYGENSIKNVAYAVGFADENYFCRVFKTVKGITASKYRKKYFNPYYKDLYPVSESDSLYPPNRILYIAGAN
ncbi:AraC family transcriptional regulator [Paenibacillus humicola]|uniref:AraC family transcriptional regulator n=1 Tax=Paenibacillus humicola TaxID=3110540 RepID=UPI00237B2160|nr:AraC family transcriptional regulator [Paenibacillus humicola]